MIQVALGSLLAAQATTCQNQGRTRDPLVPAGKNNSTTRNCASFTLNIPLIGSVTSPAQCEDSYTWRDADLFTCAGTGSGPDLCCDPNDHKQLVQLFGPSNTCPQPPAVMPANMQAAFNIVNCGTPAPGRKTYNNSAKCFPCTEPKCKGLTGKSVSSTFGDPGHGEQVGDYLAWYKNPDVYLPAADPSLVAGWGSANANIAATDLPPVMRELWLAMPPLECVQGLVASVVRTETDGNGETWTHKFVLQGAVAGDGRFSLSSTTDYEGSDGTIAATCDVSYDHRALYRGEHDATFYAAICQDRDDFVTVFQTVFAETLPLIDWARGPCYIPLRNDISWESAPAMADIDGVSIPVLQVTETYPTLNLPGQRVYDVDASGSQPRVLRIRTFLGEDVTNERTFGNFAELEPGAWRPTHMVTKWFLAGDQDPYITETLEVREARPANPDDVASWRRGSDQNKWQIFRASQD
ncbi:MAG: hypothetical protein R3F29_00535 [Planctomycetota bacterium]